MFDKEITYIYDNLPKKKPLFIGITGISGSGKTFFAKTLVDMFQKKKY